MRTNVLGCLRTNGDVCHLYLGLEVRNSDLRVKHKLDSGIQDQRGRVKVTCTDTKLSLACLGLWN